MLIKRPKIKVRCDRCGQPTNEKAGAYQIGNNYFHSLQCAMKAKEEMEEGKLKEDNPHATNRNTE